MYYDEPKKKDNWRDDFSRVSCAYCYYDCPFEVCDSRDFYCDNFLANIDY